MLELQLNASHASNLNLGSSLDSGAEEGTKVMTLQGMSELRSMQLKDT